MGLIEELHSQHREIRMHLKKIVVNREENVLEHHFKDLKTVLISHLINEDNHLYPALRNLETTKLISDSFEDEMGEISSEVMNFYTRYQSSENNESFKDDAYLIIEKLIYRIAKEERELYPLFKKYFPNK